jgi:SAM-dependent methyltransferase
MPAEALALPDGTCDVVYCQFGLMFVPEPARALREMHRVLRAGGRLGVAVWSVPEKVGLFLISRTVAPALPPVADPPPSPLGMSTPGLIEELVGAAGFGNIVVHHVTSHHEMADPEVEWQTWRATPAGRVLDQLSQREQDRLHDEVIAAHEAFRDGEVIRVRSEAIVVTAIKEKVASE